MVQIEDQRQQYPQILLFTQLISCVMSAFSIKEFDLSEY